MNYIAAFCAIPTSQIVSVVYHFSSYHLHIIGGDMGAYASFVTLKLFLPTPTVFLIGYWDHLLTENYVSTSYYVKQDDFFQL